MRILQIITLSELGGAQTVVINLSNKLSENHEVIVAAVKVMERCGRCFIPI